MKDQDRDSAKYEACLLGDDDLAKVQHLDPTVWINREAGTLAILGPSGLEVASVAVVLDAMNAAGIDTSEFSHLRDAWPRS